MDRLTVGDASVIRVEEMVDTTFTAAGFFLNFEAEALQPHMAWLALRYYIPERGALVFSMHSWVVKTGRHTVLIDTCVGNDKERMPRAHWHHLQTPFLERLRAAGTEPEDVDYVMCTHLHADHVGWNTMLKDGRWVPTFPNARYLFARIEYEHWLKNPDPNPIRRTAPAAAGERPRPPPDRCRPPCSTPSGTPASGGGSSRPRTPPPSPSRRAGCGRCRACARAPGPR